MNQRCFLSNLYLYSNYTLVTDRLKTLMDEIEEQRENLISSLKELPKEKLALQLDGKWSIHQILNHLVTAEHLSVMYLQKKIQGIEEAGDSGIMEELKMLMLIVSQRLPGLKFKAPKTVVEQTPQIDDLSTVAQQWKQVREELESLLNKIPTGKEKKLIYKHVRAGRLNIIHALKFFREHVIHHTPQIKRLL